MDDQMIFGSHVKTFAFDFILRLPAHALLDIIWNDELKTWIPLFLEVQDVAGYVPHLYLALLVSNFISFIDKVFTQLHSNHKLTTDKLIKYKY